MNQKIIQVFFLIATFSIESLKSALIRCNFRETEYSLKSCEFSNEFLLDAGDPVVINYFGNSWNLEDIQCILVKLGTFNFIPKDFFLLFENLESLVMENVGLEELRFETRPKSPSGLKSIRITENSIGIVEDLTFQDFPFLEDLDLSTNQIK
jgi:hypothetical protein